MALFAAQMNMSNNKTLLQPFPAEHPERAELDAWLEDSIVTLRTNELIGALDDSIPPSLLRFSQRPLDTADLQELIVTPDQAGSPSSSSPPATRTRASGEGPLPDQPATIIVTQAVARLNTGGYHKCGSASWPTQGV